MRRLNGRSGGKSKNLQEVFEGKKVKIKSTSRVVLNDVNGEFVAVKNTQVVAMGRRRITTALRKKPNDIVARGTRGLKGKDNLLRLELLGTEGSGVGEKT